MTRVVIHAGRTKTGTTAIQYFLGENHETLLDLGYLVPQEGLNNIYKHGPLVADILGETVSEKNTGCALRMLETIKTLSPENVVISEERLFHYFHVEQKGDIANSRVAKFFTDAGMSVAVIVYLRDDVEWKMSAYVQQVKSFHTHVSFEEYLGSVKNPIKSHYARMIDMINTPGFEVDFRPFSTDVRKHGVVKDFLAAIGLTDPPMDRFKKERQMNESVGPIALEVARQVQARLADAKTELSRAQRSAMMRKLLALTEKEEPEPRFVGLSAAEADAIDARLADDRDAFAQAAWGKSWAAVFPRRPGPGPERNIFDPASADPVKKAHFDRLYAEMWTAAREIVDGRGRDRPRVPREGRVRQKEAARLRAAK
jgi:hypothetical protein